jgi:hypothetical protein
MGTEWDESLFERICDAMEIDPEGRGILREWSKVDHAWRQACEAERAMFWEAIKTTLDEIAPDLQALLDEEEPGLEVHYEREQGDAPGA